MLFEILDERLIYFSHGRVLTKDAFLEYFDKVSAIPEVLQGKYNFFIDHSRLERVEIINDDFRQGALNRRKVTKETLPYKVAIYSNQKLGFGMGRMYQAFHLNAEETRVGLEVFSDLDEALAWLGVSELKQSIKSLIKRSAIPLRAVEQM